MKRILLVTLVMLFSLSSSLVLFAGPGAAPNSGDGVSDGSGFDVPPGPIGDGDSMGPNPLAGDGIPDGSDLPAPYGPM